MQGIYGMTYDTYLHRRRFDKCGACSGSPLLIMATSADNDAMANAHEVVIILSTKELGCDCLKPKQLETVSEFVSGKDVCPLAVVSHSAMCFFPWCSTNSPVIVVSHSSLTSLLNVKSFFRCLKNKRQRKTSSPDGIRWCGSQLGNRLFSTSWNTGTTCCVEALLIVLVHFYTVEDTAAHLTTSVCDYAPLLTQIHYTFTCLVTHPFCNLLSINSTSTRKPIQSHQILSPRSAPTFHPATTSCPYNIIWWKVRPARLVLWYYVSVVWCLLVCLMFSCTK